MGIKNKIQATITALLLGLILLMLNFISSRHFLRWDLTQDQEYTLSSSTKKIISDLKDPVTIKLFMNKNLPPNMTSLQQGILDTLAEYANRSNKKIKIEQIFPDDSPRNQQEAEMLGIPPLQLDVVAADKHEVMKIYIGIALFHLDKKAVIPVATDLSQLEYNLTSSLIKLSSEKIPRVGLVTNENRNNYQNLSQLMERQYQVVPLTFTSFSSNDSNPLDLVVLVEPYNLTSDFIHWLDNSFNEGIPILIFAGTIKVDERLSAQNYKTGLEEWLSSKGLRLSDQLVIDPRLHTYAAFSNGMMQYHVPYPFFVKVEKEGLNQKLPATAKLERLVFPWTNAITLNTASHPDWTFEILAQTSSASFLEEGSPNVMPDALQSQKVDATSSQILAVDVQAPKNSAQPNQKPSRLVVVANNQFIKDATLRDYDSNLLLPLNLADSLTIGNQLIGIRSRGKTDRPITIPGDAKVQAIKWFHIGGLPILFVITLSVLHVWRKRKWARIKLSEYD